MGIGIGNVRVGGGHVTPDCPRLTSPKSPLSRHERLVDTSFDPVVTSVILILFISVWPSVSVSGQTRIETKLRRFSMKIMGCQGKLRVWTVGLFASNRNKPNLRAKRKESKLRRLVAKVMDDQGKRCVWMVVRVRSPCY